METKSYACICINDSQRKNSSSGGIFPLIGNYILRNEGIIFAACYDKQLNVCHNRIENIDDITKAQGSKYVSSNLGDTFNDVLKCASTGRFVLFVGTPCQCAGLNAFLEKKNIDRKHIYLVDFVCHGIPGKVPWRAYKESMKKRGDEIVRVNMRDKSSGWTNGNYSWRFVFKDGRELLVPQRQVSFMKGMLANLYLRPSCYECNFKGVDRCTDYTLGDYWGVQNHLSEMDDNKGTSLVLVHSEKALKLLEYLKNEIKFKEANLIEAIKANACIIESVGMNPKRDVFFEQCGAGGDFISIVENLTKASIQAKVIGKMKSLKNKLTHRLGGGVL